MSLKQACAAVGHAKLMEAYNICACIYELKTGQILINHDDFQIRNRMLHLSNTLDSMFKNNIIPIINENDALAVDEIKVGDNDTLAGLISPMIKADLLILFSDIDGLYDKNPKIYEDAVMVDTVSTIDNNIKKMIGDSTTNVGTGGMITKINAAIIATTSGCNMIICNSNNISNLIKIIKGENIGTLFLANDKAISSREHWMIFKAKSKGGIVIDNGLKDILMTKRVSILPKGVISVIGNFSNENVIDILDINHNIIAKGITNYSSNEIKMILGHDSNDTNNILGYEGKNEIVHANNLVHIKEDYYGTDIN